MLVEVLKSGAENAKSPNVDDACEVTYSGTLKDGSKFDAGTTSFSPSQVILKVSFCCDVNSLHVTGDQRLD